MSIMCAYITGVTSLGRSSISPWLLCSLAHFCHVPQPSLVSQMCSWWSLFYVKHLLRCAQYSRHTQHQNNGHSWHTTQHMNFGHSLLVKTGFQQIDSMGLTKSCLSRIEITRMSNYYCWSFFFKKKMEKYYEVAMVKKYRAKRLEIWSIVPRLLLIGSESLSKSLTSLVFSFPTSK